MKAGRPIARRGGKIVLCNPSEAVRKVLSSTGVDEAMPVVDNEAEALAHFT